MKMRTVALISATTGFALALSACSSGGSGTTAEPSNTGAVNAAAVSGDITFLTNRTDLKDDGTFEKYVTQFQVQYPKVNVKVEAITNYEDDVRTRMSAPNGYGDVLMMPTQVPADQFSTFFEPLGKVSDLSSTYRFLAPASFDGTDYGISLGGGTNGVLYNTEVFKAAGITKAPTTPDEFLADLQKVKDKTDAIPLYTNYKDGWPLGTQWFGNVGAITCNPDAQNQMAQDKAPWTAGNDVYVIDSLLYDVVNKGLSEPDPLTTNWEQSKGDFATGKIATMVLGSWSISQFQKAATDAGVDPSVVGFMAFPATAADGTQCATIGGDLHLAVNKNSDNKDAARAWMDFLLKDSGFTDTQGMISALKDAPLPSNLSSLSDNGVKLIELAPAPAGQESLLSNIADQSKVDVFGNIYKQQLVDVARGQASGDKASFFANLNDKWGKAVTALAP